jgi:hypothetical protein
MKVVRRYRSEHGSSSCMTNGRLYTIQYDPYDKEYVVVVDDNGDELYIRKSEFY